MMFVGEKHINEFSDGYRVAEQDLFFGEVSLHILLDKHYIKL